MKVNLKTGNSPSRTSEGKHKEIAKLLQITVNTSKMRFFKARKQLQDKYAQLKNIRNGR